MPGIRQGGPLWVWEPLIRSPRDSQLGARPGLQLARVGRVDADQVEPDDGRAAAALLEDDRARLEPVMQREGGPAGGSSRQGNPQRGRDIEAGETDAEFGGFHKREASGGVYWCKS